jgi:aspartyl-tRNA(Asn)/glutamyl-tRNA(Gln) amidotransferase subunit B
MEEGSMRCDANVSVMLNGAKEFGSKVEVKNMNSIRNVQRAIDREIERQIEEVEKGNRIPSETRNFDATTGDTYSMRTKEDLNDYRYFPEPDLSPLVVEDSWLNAVKTKMPALPRELFLKFTKTYGLSEYDALVLTDTKEVALFFDELCGLTKNYKAASNWVMGPVKSYLNELTLSMEQFPLKTSQLAEIIQMIDDNKVNFSAASQRIYPEMLKNPSKTAQQIAEENNLLQVADVSFIQDAINEVLRAWPDKVQDYKNGKKGLLGLFMGEVMKKTKGKADPKVTSELLSKSLD